MYVEPSQLVQGCILVSDVVGKTGQPIVPANTTLTDVHIEVLEKFLIDHVKVSRKLTNGDLFIPKKIIKSESLNQFNYEEKQVKSVLQHYLTVVKKFKQIHIRWRNVLKIDIPEIRKLLIPLYQRIDEIDFDIFLLYKHSTKEDYIYHHSVAVGFLSAYIAQKLDYDQGELLQIGLAGFLSDSGMIKVSHSIITKEGTLGPGEWDEIKHHPTTSYRLIKDARTLSQNVKTAVLQHHERMNGTGYPLGLASENIHQYAKIIAVCDTYHAMTSERIYQKRLSPAQAVEALKIKGYSELDPKVVHAFIHLLSENLIGKRVRLSNDQIGKIIFINEVETITTPIIKMEATNLVLSLKKEDDLFIIEVLDD